MDFKIKEYNDYVEILDYIGPDVDSLELPDTINSKPVKSIGLAFMGYNKTLKSIKLNKGLEHIGDRFLFNNMAIDTVVLNDNLK